MILGLDIDGVLAETMPLIQERVKKRFSLTDYDLEDDHKDYRLADWLKPSSERSDKEHQKLAEAISRYAGGLWAEDEDLYAQALPNPEWVEFARYLKERGWLAGFVTRRPLKVAAITGWWLEQHVVERPFLVTVASDSTKGSALKLIGAEGIVEDSGHEAQEVSTYPYPLTAFLVNRSYNQQYDQSARLLRVWTPEDVKSVIDPGYGLAEAADD